MDDTTYNGAYPPDGDDKAAGDDVRPAEDPARIKNDKWPAADKMSGSPKKHRGNGFFKGALCGALVVLALLCGLLAIGNYFSGGLLLNASAWLKLQTIQSLIKDNFLYDVDEDAIAEGIYAGAVSGLDDTYSVYYDEESAKALTESTTGEYEGIGAVMQQDPDSGIITISSVYEDSPAEEAGMKADDILYKVEDEEVTGEDLSVVVTKIKGEAGTSVSLTVLRGEAQETVELEVTRRQIEIETVSYEMKDDSIGYVSISAFESVTSDQFEEALSALKEQGMKGLILDLRDNPGGVLTGACEVTSKFLEDDQLIVYTLNKKGKKTKYKAGGDPEYDGPLVVLVNGNSASASEIVTGALQDHERATIVGTTTYGKGIVQNLYDLGDGTILKLTVSEYYTPNDRNIHKKGIDPDVTVEYEADADNPEKDNQLDRAVEVLKEKM